MMFEHGQAVQVKENTFHTRGMENPLYAVVVRMMAGGKFVILDIGDDVDIRVRVEDVEPVHG